MYGLGVNTKFTDNYFSYIRMAQCYKGKKALSL